MTIDPYLGKSDYRSMQASFQKWFGGSGILTVAYTWANLRSNTDTVANFLDESNIFTGILQGNNHLDSEYSLASMTSPQSVFWLRP